MNSNIKDIYSLTPAQEGIYIQNFQNDDARLYHFHFLCEIRKDVDLELLKKSSELLFLRHPVLKTAFAVLKSTNTIKQVILENRNPEFKTFSFAEQFSQKTLDKIIEEDERKALNLQTDTLLKTIIVEFTDKRFMLVRSHHIILDGWCFPIILNDLQSYYEELSNGKSIDELTKEIRKEVSSQTSFAQYVNWLKSQDKTQALEYWKNLLDDCSYPHIFGKESNKTNKDIVSFRTYISKRSSKSIEDLSKKYKVSVNSIFESAFTIALQKFSGNDDIIFNKVISGRSIPLKNIEKTIGLFVNTVPVRIRSNKNTTLADIMKETQTQTINANTYGILALSEIYKKCNINNRLIDSLFVFENYYIGEDFSDDIEKRCLSPKTVFFHEQTEFNLSVAIFKEKGEYFIRTSYARDTYTESEISAFINGYISILKSYSDITQKISDLIVTDTSLIERFNDTAHTYNISESSTLYSLFEETAKDNKDKLCIKTAERKITFKELLNLSENLDIKIRGITGNNKSVIAVIAERSVEMYAAVYGIIRGGNAYLPIDPEYPQDRIEYILKNSNAAAVISQGKFTHLAKNLPCVDMTDFIENHIDESPEKAPVCAAEESDTAYVIYTSGSTGNPKGAKICHKSAINRILWMHDKYPLGREDVILQKTPYTFDVSVWEIFWWGICGGSLAASEPGEHFLPAKILEETSKNKVTHIHFVPSVFDLFLNYLEEHKDELCKFDSVRYVFLSGEALTSNLVNRFYKLYDYNKVTLHNLYGPTECAVDVTYYDCAAEETDPLPIGKPVYNTQIHIVDKYMNPVPIGVTGELCICGTNVGQGYLNNEELTAEKFIDNPFGEGKLYKTGDLAYWREDGNIVFCGRRDGQIKINGQRIETGEIEAVISTIPEIKMAAAIVRNINGRDILITFYSGKNIPSEHIKDICRSKLPKYMVPQFAIHLDDMPFNSNGKLDRKALEKIEIDIHKTESIKSPVTDKEEYICNLFKKILKKEDVGTDSDFFELGGTSYSMISLLSEDQLTDISVPEFMKNPTPRHLASLLDKKISSQKFEYLELLYAPKNPRQAIILLPFAGGGAEAYSNFVVSLKKVKPETAVYFIRYLHSIEECKGAANEIADILEDTEIIIYSHCVGSAVALQIITNLEKQQIPVKHFFAAASIPPVKLPKINQWNYTPDKIIKNILVRSGANFGNIPNKIITQFIKDFRKDTDFISVGFSPLDNRIKAPTTIVLNKNDLFTKNYEQAEKLWKNYSETVASVKFIDSKTHYFQSDNSDELIDIIISSL